MEITLKIEGLDGLNQAIAMLANAMQANAQPIMAQGPAVQQAIPQAIPQAPMPQPQPQPQAQMQAPMPQPQPQPQPQAQPQMQAPITPTPEPTYSWDDLALACNNVINAGKHDTVITVLSEFGINALTELTPQSYGAFMARLRLISGVNI